MRWRTVFPARSNTGDPFGPPIRGLSANEIDRALISMVARSNTSLQPEAGYIYGQPRLRKAQSMWTSRLPAVIYPVSMDPDGFRGTTPNH